MGSCISRRPARVCAVAAAVVLGALAGCGSSGPRLLDESARAGLHAQVENIRSVLGNRTQATAAVQRFRAEVHRLRDGGDLAAADASVLLDHADQIESRIRVESPLPEPPPVVAEPPTQAATNGTGKDEDKGTDEQGPGKGRGKDEGKGKKGGGDD